MLLVWKKYFMMKYSMSFYLFYLFFLVCLQASSFYIQSKLQTRILKIRQECYTECLKKHFCRVCGVADLFLLRFNTNMGIFSVLPGVGISYFLLIESKIAQLSGISREFDYARDAGMIMKSKSS